MRKSKHIVEPYLDITNWKEIVKDKHVLVDTNFLINALEYDASQIFEEFEKNNTNLCLIQPVKTELLSTQNHKDRSKRSQLLEKHKFIMLPLRQNIFDQLNDLQSVTASLGTYSSVTDLLLTSCMYSYGESYAFLLTANIKDYPFPLFTREGYIILQNEKNVRVYSLLKIDKVFVDDSLMVSKRGLEPPRKKISTSPSS